MRRGRWMISGGRRMRRRGKDERDSSHSSSSSSHPLHILHRPCGPSLLPSPYLFTILFSPKKLRENAPGESSSWFPRQNGPSLLSTGQPSVLFRSRDLRGPERRSIIDGEGLKAIFGHKRGAILGQPPPLPCPFAHLPLFLALFSFFPFFFPPPFLFFFPFLPFFFPPPPSFFFLPASMAHNRFCKKEKPLIKLRRCRLSDSSSHL